MDMKSIKVSLMSVLLRLYRHEAIERKRSPPPPWVSEAYRSPDSLLAMACNELSVIVDLIGEVEWMESKGIQELQQESAEAFRVIHHAHSLLNAITGEELEDMPVSPQRNIEEALGTFREYLGLEDGD